MSTIKRGRGRPRKFTRDEAREIRRLVKAGMATAADLAEQNKTGVATINKVVQGKGAYASTL